MQDGSFDDNDAGSSFLGCALEIAQTIENLEGRSELISLIAVKYAESGQLDVAVDAAETIQDAYQRDQTFAALTAQCIRVGAADYAERLSEMIEDDTAYALATEEMAVAYVEAGAFEKSIEVAHRLAESAPILSRVALVCVTSGQSAQALEVARSIDYAELKAPVLVELAAKALNDGRNPEVVEILIEATEAADEVEFPEQRIDTLVAIASLNKKCGQAEQAFEILSRAHQLCNASEGFDKDAVLPQIAGGFAELQRYDQAGEVMEEIEGPFQYATAAIKVALEHHKIGDSTDALALLAQASEIGRDEEVFGEQSLSMRESVLHELAVCYATLGHYEEALQTTQLMISPDQQHRTLGAIAKLCVSSGNNSRVFEVSETIKDNYQRVLCEVEVVDAFIASGQMALADHTLSQALERATAIERAEQKALALLAVAPRFQRREQTAKAAEVLFDALTTLAMIEDRHQQSLALIYLSAAYRALGLEVNEKEATILEAMRFKLE